MGMFFVFLKKTKTRLIVLEYSSVLDIKSKLNNKNSKQTYKNMLFYLDIKKDHNNTTSHC